MEMDQLLENVAFCISYLDLLLVDWKDHVQNKKKLRRILGRALQYFNRAYDHNQMLESISEKINQLGLDWFFMKLLLQSIGSSNAAEFVQDGKSVIEKICAVAGMLQWQRQLLVDPHISKDGSSSLDLVMDNPLSQKPVYPRVKVRGQEEYDDQFEYGKRSLQSLKVPEFLSSSDFSSPDDSPTSVVRVPQLDSSYPGAMNDRKPKILEENGASFKANPVFRPRAVLSSPDNDQIFGSKNKTRGESSPCSKKNGSIPSRHTKCKVVRGPVTADGPLNTRTDVKEVVARRNIFQSKQRTATPDPSLKVSKGNPKPIQDGALRKSPMTKR